MDHVINYDLPTDRGGYVQRCGRTGRTHNGTAMSFYLEDENRSLSSEIARVIRENGQEVPSFLENYVTENDYNFGENIVNESNNGYDNYNTISPPATANVSNDSDRNYSQPAEIVDPSADDCWD
jgi:superfamily II DNA/RNA helicase